MKESFSEKLTTEDIKKILSKCGLKLADYLPNPIMRGLDEENNEYSIMLKAMPDNTTHSSVNVTAFPLGQGEYIFLPNYFADDDVLLLEIRDFIMYEMASLMDDEGERLKRSRYLNEMYNQYMESKFGEEYKKAYEEYSETLKKQIENEEQQDIEM